MRTSMQRLEDPGIAGAPRAHRAMLLAGLLLVSCASPGRELSLPDAIALARQQNYEHLNRVDDIALAELDYANVRSGYRTQIRASGNSNAVTGAELGSYYGIALSKENVSGSRYAAGLYNSSYGERSLSELRFSYTLPFFNQGKREANQLEIDKSRISVARRQRLLHIAAEELESEVTAAYYHKLLTRRRSRMLRDQMHLTEAALERARIRKRAGELNSLHQEQAELRLGRSEQALLQAEFQDRLAADRLKMLLALDLGESLTLSSPITAPDALPLLDMPLETLESMAVAGRQELQGQREEITLTRRRMSNLGDRILPDFDIELQYSLIGEGSRFDDSIAFDDQQWGIGLRMDTDFGARKRRSQRSRIFLRIQSMQRAYDALEQQVRMDVRSKRFDLNRATRSLEIAQRSYRLTERTLEQTRIMADRGQLSTTSLLESELDLTEAHYQLRAAEADLALAAYALELALGGLQ